MTDNGTGPVKRAQTVIIGDRDVTVEPPSGRKAQRAFVLIRQVSKEIPGLVKKWGQFQTEYEATNVVELDRAQAMLRYGPGPLTRDGVPVQQPAELITFDSEGKETGRAPNPHAGELVMVPGAFEAMSEDDWQKSGNKLRLPKSPSMQESAAAIFADALDVAEDHTYRLIALFTMSNEDVARRRKDGTIDAELEQIVEDLLDTADADELFELAVVCGEVVDGQFRAKAASLGDRLGNALRLLGLNRPQGPNPGTPNVQTAPEAPQTAPEEEGPTTTSPTTPTPPPSSSRPTSSSGTAEPSEGGDPTPSSTPTTPSSVPSDDDSRRSAPV